MEIFREMPSGDGSFSTFYKASSIRDIMEYETDFNNRAKQSYDQSRKRILSADTYFRFSFALFRLLDPRLSTYYDCTDYIYIPRIRHDNAQNFNQRGRSMTIYDMPLVVNGAHLEVYPPNSLEQEWLKEKGWEFDFKMLKRSTWTSPVILSAFFTPIKAERYRLLRVFNKYATERQEEEVLGFLRQFGLQHRPILG